MSIWRVAPVQEHPEAQLVSWRVFELPDGDRHFCGYETYFHEGRVCSRVVSFDPETRQGVTRSGRCYELVGPPGDNADALYVWDRWCTRNAVEEFTDVSDLVYKEFTN
jgi:hypothetical protein